ncbi:MAG TPA: ElyC/SanA/YdcF family protein [Nitrospira sp.]|nr:ElyC/SanA/YdcF family protein [Nitrospira sp.]
MALYARLLSCVMVLVVVFLLMFEESVRTRLLVHLCEAHPVPPATSVDVIYVLGGGQSSLEKRFPIAASLYKDQIAGRVLILSRPGITEYSTALGRNLTNDEWAYGKLSELGISRSDIETVPAEKGFFGTLSEAAGISSLVKSRGYKTLILVTSDYHTKRVWKSFSKLLENTDVALYIYTAADPSTILNLIPELAKLLVYRIFLL